MRLSAASRKFWHALDPARVAGIAAAILINFAVVGVLLMPPAPADASTTSGASLAPTTQAPETDDYLHWVIVPRPMPIVPQQMPMAAGTLKRSLFNRNDKDLRYA